MALKSFPELNLWQRIFREHWASFVLDYIAERGEAPPGRREENVERMLARGDIREGCREYLCERCGEHHKVGFTCKSRLCPRRFKTSVDNWLELTRHSLRRRDASPGCFDGPDLSSSAYRLRRGVYESLHGRRRPGGEGADRGVAREAAHPRRGDGGASAPRSLRSPEPPSPSGGERGRGGQIGGLAQGELLPHALCA
jgi:hypothetical protein